MNLNLLELGVALVVGAISSVAGATLAQIVSVTFNKEARSEYKNRVRSSGLILSLTYLMAQRVPMKANLWI